MSGYDATSLAAQLAGATEPAKERVTPEQLIARFCAETSNLQALVAEAGTTAEAWAAIKDVDPGEPKLEQRDGYTVARGQCGYVGGRGDSMVDGFDDGYDFMGYLGDRGWAALHEKGDWPYVVYLAYAPREPYAIVEYCEADLTVWTFDSGEAAQAFYRTLKDAP